MISRLARICSMLCTIDRTCNRFKSLTRTNQSEDTKRINTASFRTSLEKLFNDTKLVWNRAVLKPSSSFVALLWLGHLLFFTYAWTSEICLIDSSAGLCKGRSHAAWCMRKCLAVAQKPAQILYGGMPRQRSKLTFVAKIRSEKFEWFDWILLCVCEFYFIIFQKIDAKRNT